MSDGETDGLSQSSPPSRNDHRWMSGLQAGFSLLGALSLFSMALVFAVFSLAGQFGNPASRIDAATGLVVAAGLTFIGLVLLLSAWYAILGLLGKAITIKEAFSRSRWLWLSTGLLLGLLPVVLLLGQWVIAKKQLTWILLPPLHLVAVAIPVLWLSILSLRGLPVGSAQRAWGLLGVGMSLSPFLILGVELIALILVTTLAFSWISLQPGIGEELFNLMQQFQIAPSEPEALLRALQPYLLRPEIIGLGAIFVVVIIPLVEESLKPLGMWFLLEHRLSPAEGFTAGLICGAGYAFFENLFLSNTLDQWNALVLARGGTTVIHLFATALTGWGLASAWTEGRFTRLGFAFIGAMVLHGLWNGLTLLLAAASLSSEMLTLPTIIIRISSLAPIGLAILALFSLTSIWIFNRRLKRAIIPELS